MDYVSLSNAMMMRKHLYEICTTISISDHKDMKQKMLVSCDSRIPSFSIHYLATLLDPTLSGLKPVKDYFATTSVVPFVIQMVQDLGLSLSKLYPADRPEPVTSTFNAHRFNAHRRFHTHRRCKP